MTGFDIVAFLLISFATLVSGLGVSSLFTLPRG